DRLSHEGLVGYLVLRAVLLEQVASGREVRDLLLSGFDFLLQRLAVTLELGLEVLGLLHLAKDAGGVDGGDAGRLLRGGAAGGKRDGETGHQGGEQGNAKGGDGTSAHVRSFLD